MAQKISVSRRRGRVGVFPPGLLRPRPRLADPGDEIRVSGAAVPPTRVQVAIAGLAVALLLAGVIRAPDVVHLLFFLLFLATALTRLIAGLMQVRSPVADALPDEALPPYTVIAPLYREAEIAPQLIDSLCAIDYPVDRLQIILVLECDDHETRDALSALTLPAFVQVLAAPPGHPRTKPRACNVALERATGALVTIYDAEDRPDPGQLREAASRFAIAPARLACLQAPLRIDPDRRVLPGQFALEYASQFEVLLPALAWLDAPFPLGGTSNHFRLSALRAVGGWDAWNVTEDADLGFRLAAEGYRMGVLSRPTWESAPVNLRDWIPQRARWVKGYMQTFGVHSRTPPHWRTGATAAFAATLGSAIAAAFLHGPLTAWVLMAAVLGLIHDGAPWVRPADAALLVFGWASAAFAGAVGLRRAGQPVRARDLLLMPLYWPLHSLAAIHALIQLLDRPFHWDKTPHAPRTGQPIRSTVP